MIFIAGTTGGILIKRIKENEEKLNAMDISKGEIVEQGDQEAQPSQQDAEQSVRRLEDLQVGEKV